MSGTTIAHVSQLTLRTNASGTVIVGYDPVADTFVTLAPSALQGLQGPTGPTGPAGPTGPQGVPGSAGTNGRTVLSGVGIPSASTGSNGDFYIDTSAWRIHGPKANGVWPAGVSLIGPAGPTGPAGSGGSGTGLPAGGVAGQILVSDGTSGVWTSGTSIVADRTPTVAINTPTALTFANHNRRRLVLTAAASLTLSSSEVNAGGAGMEFTITNRHTAINQITFGAGITVLQPAFGTGTGGVVKIAAGSASTYAKIAVDIYPVGSDRIAEISGDVA